ncbi:MAG: helix-turn-helix transcriptional regulator [Arcticibacter sp.]
MMIRNYELKQDILIKRLNQNHPDSMILFHFQHIQHTNDGVEKIAVKNDIPLIRVTTRGLNSDVFLPACVNERSVSILMDAVYLNTLIDSSMESTILNSILKNEQPLLFEELVFPSLQKILDEMASISVPDAFSFFYHKLKAEELVCTLLMELLQREEVRMFPLNIADIKTLYRVKDLLLQRLDQAPAIEEMAREANMSESKLTRLSKQVFGKSMFNYYQNYRMTEAARLLKNERLSVSEVGYRLGFSNLSQFSRVFEEHLGLKPKKYSSR